MNSGATVATLTDCMAAMPCAGASRASARITKAEKAKNTPAIRAQPSAAAIHRTSNVSIGGTRSLFGLLRVQGNLFGGR